ncbi:MAG TPA: phosphotransferase [Marinagarivorans sp.]
MTTRLPKAIKDNMQFLCAEVDLQLGYLQDYFQNKATPTLARRILDRRGYASNLTRRIQRSSLDYITQKKSDEKAQLILRAVDMLASTLEEITSLCRSCIEHSSYINDFSTLHSKQFSAMIKLARKGVQQILPAVELNNTQLALSLNELEGAVSRHYKRSYKAYIAELKDGQRTEDLTRALFIVQNLQQIGEGLKAISEALISANLGQSVNFERYQALQSMMGDLGESALDTLKVETIAETRSGSSITGISNASAGDDKYLAIVKEGIKRKVKEERQGVESWHDIYPGLAPKILSYKKSGQSAAILIEHLPGQTFESILVNEPAELLDEALKKLGVTLRSVWRTTKSGKVVCANYMAQLAKRLPLVYQVHPEFNVGKSMVGDIGVPSFAALLQQAQKLEQQLNAPFSVYIHGDFNVDNIIYDSLENKINFIDLHRSQYMDYVQDVSVFMVSNYRLQILDKSVRRRIMQTALQFYKMAKRFSQSEGDNTFELRLALGLARSFASSTRFILDKSLSRRMFLRARYILELFVKADLNKPQQFKLPLKEIFVD